MSERLEGIKNVLHMNTYLGRPLMVRFDPDDIDWLIEQAEENERLRDALEGLGKAVEIYSGMPVNEALKEVIELVEEDSK